MSYTRPYQKAGDLLLGSWTRTIAVLAVALLVFGVLAWAAASGSLAAIGTWNIPFVHRYPPAGQVQNPFGPRGDLISVSEARTVKSDLLLDGQIELKALETGDSAVLAGSTTGGALTKLRQLIDQNNASGIFEREEIHLDSVVVGRLSDPNDPSVAWCVEERGSASITYVSKTTGQPVRTASLRFDNKYWLVKEGGRYLITDVGGQAQPTSG